LRALPGLLPKLAGQSFSAKNKVAMAAFFLLGSLTPNRKGMGLLAYRLKTGHRSALGFVKEMIG
jgi:hypothetical protein